jgi:hypothetical protein
MYFLAGKNLLKVRFVCIKYREEVWKGDGFIRKKYGIFK